MAKEAIDSNNSEFAARCLQNVALCHYDAGDNALATVHFALSAQYFAAAGNYCRAAECSEKAAICTSDVELSVCYYKLAAKYYMKINQSDSATEMNTKAEIEHDRVGRFDFPDQKMIPNYLKEMSNACKEYAAAAKVEEVLLQIAKRSEALAQKCMSDVFYYEWCSHLSNELTKDLWKQISNSDKFEDKDLWKQIRYFDKFEETLHACLTHRKTVKDLWGEFRYFDETKEVLHVCLASHKLAKDAYAQIGNSDKVKEMLYEIMKDLRLLEVLQVLRDLHRKGLANVETNEAYVECLVQLEELYMATGDMVSAIEFINEARHRLLLTKKCFRFAKNKAKARECSAKAKRYADMVSGILRALPATANTSARLENRRAVIPRVMLTFASKIGNLLRANGREAATVEETQKINDTAVDPNAI
jgi:tetratricopeptide (TPR) repeat protein